MKSKGVAPALRAAFLECEYGPPDERFRFSDTRAEAPAWAAGRWAIVTAWNPLGQPHSPEFNAAAAARLREKVTGASYRWRESVNGSGEWAEESLLIFDVPLREALAWAREFEQAALVYGVGARAALVWAGGRVERRWARAEG